jgi:hypothetical protein
MPAYALTIFIGAFLLFQVQPLIGKFVLPWFGGGPSVWTTCLLFFQVVLLAGYAYAHFTTRWLKPRAQVLVHLGLLAAALALLPITPAAAWKPTPGGNPTMQILLLLAVAVGMPYFVLASTGPLIQQWFSRAHPGVSPYRLYALSNIGSLLALVSYPFYFETHFTRKAQAGMWAWGLAAYALCCGFCAWKLWKGESRNQESSQSLLTSSPTAHSNLQPATLEPATSPANRSPLSRILWLLLPACASALLLATTNKMCQDVAVIPFLWILPLGLYLLSFIICFDSPRWYIRFPFTLALIAAAVAMTWALFEGIDASAQKQVIIYSAGLFICCLVCHGELYRLRPEPRYLTSFYLMISAGGALGGLFVAVIAPMIFKDYYEFHWSLFACALLFLIVCLVERKPALPATKNEEQIEPNPHSLPRQSQAAAGAFRNLHSNEWLWSSCALFLVGVAGVDWYARQSMPQFVAWVAAKVHASQSHGVAGSLVGALSTIVNSKRWLLSLRMALWTIAGFVALYWLIRGKFASFRYWRLVSCGWLGVGVVALGFALGKQAGKSAPGRVYTSRNFYGVFTIYEENKEAPQDHLFRLQHGRITHGLQLVDPDEAYLPTTYYGETSGIGLAMRALPPENRRIGLVGLGTGTASSYVRAGDYLRVYEINPEARHLATSRFSYITHCPGKVDIVMGDARLSMEREPSQQFDLLALDAFSGDAIPVHLLTKEAFEIYQRQLKTNGILVVHISNHYLDLEPVVVNLAHQFNYQVAAIDHDEGEEEPWDYSSTWIILSRNKEVINSPAISSAAYAVKTNYARVPLWTDDFTAMFQILK